MHTNHVLNVLGAASLSVTDLMTAAVTTASDTSTSGSAALAVLLQTDGLGVTELGRRLGLSQPAAARMIDSLERSELVRRTRGPGRQVTVTLTETGTGTARALLLRRSERLADIIGGFSTEQQRLLADLLDQLLTGIYDEIGDADLICRLCDRTACTSGVPPCPVGEAAGEAPDA